MQEMYAKYKDKGLEIVSVDVMDNADVIKKWADQGHFTFNMVLNPTDKDENNIAKVYGVRATPTNIILDSNGNVVDKFIGFDPDGLTKDFHKLGIND